MTQSVLGFLLTEVQNSLVTFSGKGTTLVFPSVSGERVWEFFIRLLGLSLPNWFVAFRFGSIRMFRELYDPRCKNSYGLISWAP